jgi:hypothetical protein
MPLGPRSVTCVQPAPKVAICVVWDIAHLEAKSKANAALGFRANLWETPEVTTAARRWVSDEVVY